MKNDQVQVEEKGRDLILSRMFEAPRELVFKMFSSCDHLSHWWGPKQYPMSYCNLEFKEGGTWHFCLLGPEGQESWGKAVYQEITEPERIVYTDNFSDSEGNINEEMPGMLITVELVAIEGKTKLISTTQFDNAEQLQKIVEMGAIQGISETWDRLEEHLAKLTANI